MLPPLSVRIGREGILNTHTRKKNDQRSAPSGSLHVFLVLPAWMKTLCRLCPAGWLPLLLWDEWRDVCSSRWRSSHALCGFVSFCPSCLLREEGLCALCGLTPASDTWLNQSSWPPVGNVDSGDGKDRQNIFGSLSLFSTSAVSAWLLQPEALCLSLMHLVLFSCNWRGTTNNKQKHFWLVLKTETLNQSWVKEQFTTTWGWFEETLYVNASTDSRVILSNALGQLLVLFPPFCIKQFWPLVLRPMLTPRLAWIDWSRRKRGRLWLNENLFWGEGSKKKNKTHFLPSACGINGGKSFAPELEPGGSDLVRPSPPGGASACQSSWTVPPEMTGCLRTQQSTCGLSPGENKG